VDGLVSEKRTDIPSFATFQPFFDVCSFVHVAELVQLSFSWFVFILHKCTRQFCLDSLSTPYMHQQLQVNSKKTDRVRVIHPHDYPRAVADVEDSNYLVPNTRTFKCEEFMHWETQILTNISV
jgi:hypothetical protein